MAKLYTNENFPLPAVEALRKLGHDVLTIQETGKANRAMTDEDVLAFAHRQKRILLTLNRKHFIRLHQQASDHHGVIVCSFDPNFQAFAERIHGVLAENLTGKLVRINRPQK